MCGLYCKCSIDEQQDRCRSRAVGSCNATTRDRINASYAAIQREWSKVCYPSPPQPLPIPPINIGKSVLLHRPDLSTIRSFPKNIGAGQQVSAFWHFLLTHGWLKISLKEYVNPDTLTFGKHWKKLLVVQFNGNRKNGKLSSSIYVLTMDDETVKIIKSSVVDGCRIQQLSFTNWPVLKRMRTADVQCCRADICLTTVEQKTI